MIHKGRGSPCIFLLKLTDFPNIVVDVSLADLPNNVDNCVSICHFQGRSETMNIQQKHPAQSRSGDGSLHGPKLRSVPRPGNQST